jgi:hypothetical protein
LTKKMVRRLRKLIAQRSVVERTMPDAKSAATRFPGVRVRALAAYERIA